MNLVEQVSTTRKKLYSPIPKVDNPLRIIAIDVGMKNNQIRCLLKRNVEVLVVPWDYDFSKESFDGVFVSNGPGDPTVLKSVIERLRILMEVC